VDPDLKGAAASWRRLERLERAPLGRNLDLQWRALRRLVAHAFETTPFYRRRLAEAGLHPDRLSSPDDLKRLPPLTREDLKANLEDLWSRRYRRSDLQEAATGGTTDVPVRLLRNPEMLREKAAIQMRLNAWAGCYPGDPVMWFWGARSDYPERPSGRWRLFERWVGRRVWAPISLLDEATLRSHLEAMNRFRPKVLVAYPSPLAVFCEWLRSQPSRARHHRPESVISTAEALTPDQRALIEEVLGCPVFEHYGARDFGMVAGQCERLDRLHLNPHAVHVESRPISDADGSDVEELLVTDLLNYGMPLIRYQVNDCATAADASEACPCGRGYPLLGRLSGRVTENFTLASGAVVPGVAFTNRLVRVCPGLRKIQVIQQELSRFDVKYVASSAFEGRDLERLAAKMREFLGPVQIAFEPVDDVPRERSGKTRLCISRVAPISARPERAPA
jgi:phenylacetate-CoA ligase